jgi:hypothetical protein
MLKVDPRKRPGIERILTLPFTKRYISEFLGDIVNRPSSNIGDGTVIVRRAAINIAEEGGRRGEAPEVQR